MKYFRKNDGITLIALVITIIIMLILATVSIRIAVNGGLFKYAQKAIENTEEAEKKEKEILAGYDDIVNEYIEIDWNIAMANAKAPEGQHEERNNGVIGIGTDGKPVNMDLWNYFLLNDGTYGLNTKENLQTEASKDVIAGYLGNFTDDGKIIGKVPQYISSDSGKTFIEVTDLKWLFFNCKELKIAPKLPTTAKYLAYTFRGCENLITVSEIPSKVIDMKATFMDYKKLEKTPKLPDSVINLTNTFCNCVNLNDVINLPNKVENMETTFIYCSNLKTVPIIPNSVTNMIRTFYGCENLNGILEINANLTGAMISSVYGDLQKDNHLMFYDAVQGSNCKLKLIGTCPTLGTIVTDAKNPNITL